MLSKIPIDGSPAASGFLLAAFDGFSALFAQRDVSVIEQRSVLANPRDCYAEYCKGDLSVRVFSLSKGFAPLAPADRPFFFVARCRAGAFGLACDELQVVNASRVSIKAIPASLKCGESPIEGYAQFGKRVAFLCSLEAIADLLPLTDTGVVDHEQSIAA
ncbi:MAG: hypothetical protein KIT13_05275 [Burkholderiales bacterium]|nr:hypothetical protein [Burkholderiales bacterium]MCW5575487.1 hypothetical protein [Burkholderiales bacterium]MCW5604549.1 hypothetical protein [Burkholderiales bacterium]